MERMRHESQQRTAAVCCDTPRYNSVHLHCTFALMCSVYLQRQHDVHSSPVQAVVAVFFTPSALWVAEGKKPLLLLMMPLLQTIVMPAHTHAAKSQHHNCCRQLEPGPRRSA